MFRRPRLLRVALGLTLAACGASPRMMHEGRVYYERCYAADLDDARTPGERRSCWDAWLTHYAEGQPVVRVAHARERLAALSGDGPAEPQPLPRSLPAGSDTPPSHVDPLGEPQDPSTPRGNVDDRLRVPLRNPPIPYEDRPRPPAPPPSPPPTPPTRLGTEPCLELCDPRWRSCVEGCPERGPTCRSACVAAYHLCMDGCG